MVKWEPYHGKLYGVLFTRLLEIYSVDSDQPIHSCEFDSIQTGFCFMQGNSIVVSDAQGRLTVFTGVSKPETIQMKILETKLIKFRSVESYASEASRAKKREEGDEANEDLDEHEFITTVSKSGVEFWNAKKLL